MDIHLILAQKAEIDIALSLFKSAAESIAKKNIDHWQYWKKPTVDNIAWVQEGFDSKQFYFIKNALGETVGMLRIMEEDLSYWGAKNDQAKYIHSLVVLEQYKGLRIGNNVLQIVEQEAVKHEYNYLRLDCLDSNPGLCQYYENYGFTKVGTKHLPPASYSLYEKRL